MTAPLETALSYIRRGWNPVPVGFREKRPTAGEGWQNIRITAENAARHFNGAPQNTGVQLGPASNNLRDIDLDCPEAMAAAPYFLPKTGAIFGRPSARNTHWLYYADDFGERLDKGALQYRDPSKKMLVELRVGEGDKGAQSVFPGSTHVSGEEIRWELDGEPAKVDGADLRRRVEIVATIALLARSWPELGSRHEARLAIGGMLARAGWKLQEADLFAQALKAAVRSDSDDFRPAVKSSFAKVTANQPATGFTTVAEIFGKEVGEKVRIWLRLAYTDHGFAWSDGDSWGPLRPSYPIEDPERAPQSDPLDGVVFDGDVAPAPERMLVKRLIPFEGIAFLGGQSGAGKTFVAVDLAVSLASGEPFFGQKVCERVGVAIVAAEGAGTISNRIHVARNEKAHGEILPIAWIKAPPDLSNQRELPAFIAKLKAIGAKMQETHGVRLGAIVVDTLAAAFGLKDENDNSEAARAIRQMHALSNALGAVILPIHHYGKSEETGLRGASAWRAGADVVLSICADRNKATEEVTNRRLSLAKARSGEEGEIAGFDLKFVRVGIDEDGEEYGACYVVPVTGRTSRPVSRLSRAGRFYVAALETALLSKGDTARPFGGDGPEVRAVDREDVRAEFYRTWPSDGDTEKKRAAARRQRFRTGELEAIDHGAVAVGESAGKQLVWSASQ